MKLRQLPALLISFEGIDGCGKRTLLAQLSSWLDEAPGVSLYISLLYKAMKERRLHEGCIHQMDRLYRDFLFSGKDLPLDSEGRIRLDDCEMRSDVQQAVAESWEKVTTENLAQYADLNGFREEFLRHHGFGMPRINYSQPVDPTRI